LREDPLHDRHVYCWRLLLSQTGRNQHKAARALACNGIDMPL